MFVCTYAHEAIGKSNARGAIVKSKCKRGGSFFALSPQTLDSIYSFTFLASKMGIIKFICIKSLPIKANSTRYKNLAEKLKALTELLYVLRLMEY